MKNSFGGLFFFGAMGPLSIASTVEVDPFLHYLQKKRLSRRRSSSFKPPLEATEARESAERTLVRFFHSNFVYNYLKPEVKQFVKFWLINGEQVRFVSQELASAQKVILAIHDATQLKYLRNSVALHLRRKIILTLVGHFHLPLFGKLFALQPFIRRLNLKVVPSSLGWMTPYGVVVGNNTFCVLEIVQEGSFKLSYHS